MQQPDLFTNIQEAREQLHKLKQEASILQSHPQNHNNLQMRQYMKSVAYQITKNERNIEQTFEDYKNKLPFLKQNRQKNVPDSQLHGYKKHRKHFKSKKKVEESTRIEPSVSFSVQNRPMKFYSHHDKNIRADISTDEVSTNLMIPSEILTLKDDINEIKEQTSNRKFGRSVKRQTSQMKAIKYIDINSKTKLKDEEQDLLKEPNDYGEIVDKYSKHEFMIINGRIANQGPEFASFSRVYQSIYPRIKFEIGRLEIFLQEKSINFARFDGKKLAYLCLKDEIKKHQLIDCLIDQSGLLKGQLLPASKFLGKQGKLMAALKIQSFVRMKSTQTQYKVLKQKTLLIQNFFRRKLLRIHLQKRIHERNSGILQRFSERQDRLKTKWLDIKKQKRIEIHLNCIEVDQQKRLSIENFSERQNIQLSRIFRLKDENLIIIYVSSMDLPNELINYYYRLLQLANIPKYQDRLIFFTPKDADKFPKHFSVSKLLYYSSKTLNQLKIITQDLPTIIYPGNPTNQLIKICDFLSCYLFSSQPQKLKPFTTRSQTLRFFQNLSLESLPSVMEMYDYGEFLNTFSILILRNPEIDTWVLKIDDEIGGRGIAYLDVSRWKFIQSLLRRVEYEENQTFATDMPTDSINQEIAVKIREQLRDNLHTRLKFAAPTVYHDYEEYMGRFIKKGGIIEGKPSLNSRESLSYPCISFCLHPHGQVEILTTYEKMIGTPYRSYACSFPANFDLAKGESIVRQICDSFKLRGIFGHFTADFISKKQSGKENQKLWIIDIDPYINDYTSSFFLFDILMGGTYLPEKNIYMVEENEQKNDRMSINTMSSEINSRQGDLSERKYIFIPHFENQYLYKLKMKEFFKRARLQQFNFDIAQKQGLCILLLDQLTSGTLSLISIFQSHENSVQMIKRFMQFMGRICQVKNVQYGHYDEPSSDRINVKDMISMFVSLVRKEERGKAKQKAFKHFQNNGNLQFIC